MINNRQTGRRRGRGGQRPSNNQGREQGNRIDNRARGNASQLHEKYKTLARDAQMQGDRVNTEYYLQFADHYFRVLSESRARFEESNPNRRPQNDEDEDGYDVRSDDDGDDRGNGNGHDRGQRQPARAYDNGRAARDDDRDEGNDRYERGDRADGNRQSQRPPLRARQDEDRFEQPRASADPADADARAEPRRRGRPPKARPAEDDGQADGSIEIDRLPPALAKDEPLNGDDGGEAPAPKRRGRKPRAEGVDPVASAS